MIRRNFLTLVLLFIVTLLQNVVFAEEDRWTSRGHIGDGISALAVNPDNASVVYAGVGSWGGGLQKL